MTEPVDRTETLTGSLPEPDGAHPPRVLGGRYLLEERIASGGMASVWRAHDEKLARTVAVKVLHEHLSADDAFRERFRREAISAAKLSHPNVVGVYDTGSDSGWVYLVMEYVEGITLRDVIANLGTLSPGHAAAIGEQVARALHYAHARGLVHRDVKPANILIGEDGVVKVADFGIAKAEESGSDLTRTGMVLGTAAYVAPEQILGDPLDGRADQYALGCMLYEMLAGRQPFKGNSAMATAAARLEAHALPMRSFRPDIPRGLDAAVMRAMARQPDDRFPSAAEFASELAQWAEGNPGQGVDIAALAVPAPGVDVGSGETRPPPRDATTTGSFLRSEGRWLGSVVALVLLAGALAAVGALTGVIETDTIPNLRARLAESLDAGQEQEDAAPEPQMLEVALESLDPQGDPQTENDADLPLLLDGDEETFWRTDLYNTAEFGNLKDGVGIIADLGERHRIRTVTLRTPSPGIRFDVRVANEPHEDAGAWETLESVTGAETVTEIDFEPGVVSARYVLVWITPPLVEFDGRWSAAFSEMTVTGLPQ